MVGKASGPGRVRIPLGLLGAVALVVAVEASIAHEKMGSLGGSQWSCEDTLAGAGSAAQGSRVLCFGDSLIKQGLAPTVVEARSGLPAYNLALAGGQAPASYFLLRKALASGAKPDAVVVEYFPRLLSLEPEFNIENWPFLANPADAYSLARLSGNPSLGTDLILRDLLPSVRCRASIRANILAAFNGSFPAYAREIRSARRNWEVNRGAEIVASQPDRVDDLDAWMKGYFPVFRCTRTNRAYIKKLLELAASREIPVFWVLPPYKPTLQARVEQNGFDAAHEAFVRSMMSRYPGLHVVDGRHAGYDPRAFADPHHLGADGATVFSESLAEVLRAYKADPSKTPRWQPLADYRAVAGLRPPETMDESRRKVFEIAVQDPSTRKR